MMIRRLPLLFASITGTYGSLSRWWFMLQLVQSGWSNQGGPGPGDTVAVIVSGTEGGSAETNHPGGSTKAYIPKMINLLAPGRSRSRLKSYAKTALLSHFILKRIILPR
jgi:hypothetical protein